RPARAKKRWNGRGAFPPPWARASRPRSKSVRCTTSTTWLPAAPRPRACARSTCNDRAARRAPAIPFHPESRENHHAQTDLRESRRNRPAEVHGLLPATGPGLRPALHRPERGLPGAGGKPLRHAADARIFQDLRQQAAVRPEAEHRSAGVPVVRKPRRGRRPGRARRGRGRLDPARAAGLRLHVRTCVRRPGRPYLGTDVHGPQRRDPAAMSSRDAVDQAIGAVWRIESARVIAGVARLVRDVGLAEELAHDALVTALERWPGDGIPDNPGAWLMTAAKNRALARLRQDSLHARKHEQLGYEMDALQAHVEPDFVDALDAARQDEIGDDLLRLVFTAC